MAKAAKNTISIAKIAGYLLVIILPVLTILLNFKHLALNSGFNEKLQGQIQSNLPLKERMYYSNNVLDFYKNKADLDHNFYSEQAQLHLKAVKNLLVATKVIVIMSIIITLILMLLLTHEKRYEIIFTATFYGSLLCLLFIAAIAIGLTQNFDIMFTGMHKILFSENLWLFPPDDNLVNVFPVEFFVLFANSLALNIVYSSTVLLIVSAVGLVKLKRRT